MKKPDDRQIAVATAGGTTSAIAIRFDVSVAKVLEIRRAVAEYRRWEALTMCEAKLPLSERRVEFMPLSRRTRNALRRHGIETGADLLAMPGQDLFDIRSAGKAARNEIRRYLDQEVSGRG